MLLGSVKEALSYGANTFMFYTGAPQNTRRKAISELKVEEAKTLMKENNIDLKNVVVHAPYIINLANTIKEETFELAVNFLKQELQRCQDIGTSILVLHPGSHVKAGEEVGLQQIIKGLNEVLKDTPYQGKIALETMAGKGSEVGGKFEELREILDRVELKDKMGVCLDTCHISDAGYDIIHDLDGVLETFDKIIGLDRLKAIHLNDSKNPPESHKDRHEKVGQGYLGIETLEKVINHPKLKHLPFLLETPNELPGYAEEIKQLKSLYRQ